MQRMSPIWAALARKATGSSVSYACAIICNDTLRACTAHGSLQA